MKCCSGEGGKGLSRFILENKSLKTESSNTANDKDGSEGGGEGGRGK